MKIYVTKRRELSLYYGKYLVLPMMAESIFLAFTFPICSGNANIKDLARIQNTHLKKRDVSLFSNPNHKIFLVISCRLSDRP
jgi:hypothetical protein